MVGGRPQAIACARSFAVLRRWAGRATNHAMKPDPDKKAIDETGARPSAPIALPAASPAREQKRNAPRAEKRRRKSVAESALNESHQPLASSKMEFIL